MSATSHACRILEYLEIRATDDTIGVGTKDIADATGMARRTVQLVTREMIATGALELLVTGAPPRTANVYRIARADLVSREPLIEKWSAERMALLNREYPHTSAERLVAALNALPGSLITAHMIRNKAGDLSLKHTPEYWSATRSVAAQRMRRLQSAKVAPKPARRVPVAPPVFVAPTPIVAPKSVSGMRYASSVTSRSPVINWSALPPPPARVKGKCCWALACSEPAVGAWCVGHGALIGRAA